MYCQKCSAENPDDAHRCLSCGYEFAHISPSAAPVAVNTSRAAVAALVLGVLTFATCSITALPAVICGIVALVKISGSNGLLKGKGMAITGLVLPAVHLIIVPLLLAIFMPALSKVNDQAKTVVCKAHLRQLSLGVLMYADHNDGQFPTASKWGDLVLEYAGSDRELFRCLAGPEGIYGYAFNRNLDSLKRDQVDPQTVMVFEADAVWNDAGDLDMAVLDRHPRPGCNVGFTDGHIEFVSAERIGELKWNPNK